ncbi:MAG: ECF transporter S component [Clostridiales bacterium]|nr:ECF transporter S component [Clostridiales bacterium]
MDRMADKEVLGGAAAGSLRLGVKEIALCGLFGALGAILMMFRFPIPFMPPFMSFDLSGLLEMIGGFMMGPVAAVMIILVKILVQVVTTGTKSAMTGELQNFILSCCYVLPAVLIYDRHKTRQRAIAGMAVGTVVCALVAVGTNIYIIIPFYVNLMGMTWEGIIGMCAKVSPLMKDVTTMAIFGIIPFNLIKYGITSVLTLIVYKKVSRPMKEFMRK